MQLPTIASAFLATCAIAGEAPIDRHALVSRHNLTLTALNADRPISVGNGEFAFNMDITGLQTFVPFNTMSQWGWHSGPPPAGTKVSDYQMPTMRTHGRDVPYPLYDHAHPEISQYLAASPHRIDIGRVGMVLTKQDGSVAQASDITGTRQHLDLWSGIVTSTFSLEGTEVKVTTTVHPTLDAVVCSIDSPLVTQSRIAVYLAVPGNNPLQFANYVGDWSSPAKLDKLASTQSRADYKRTLDDHTSFVTLSWSTPAAIKPPPTEIPELKIVSAKYGAHDKWLDVTDKVSASIKNGIARVPVGNNLGPDPIHGVYKQVEVTYTVTSAGKTTTSTTTAVEGTDLLLDAAPERQRITLAPSAGASRLDFLCTFSPTPIPSQLPDTTSALTATRDAWKTYWTAGGAIDLSGSTDPRARELERRIILSQYQMKVHEAGSLPPQESGLLNNGWFGRFHLEMVWWHAAHWALWNRWPELNRSIDFYADVMPGAQALAKLQGYKGARWPKCIGPDNREWPHIIHSTLLWQQPHPIFFAELDYRAHPTPETLKRWAPIIEATADFMATYAFRDPATNRYVLGPPLQVVSENAPVESATNPAFELGYWRFGLRVAQTWRERMGLERNKEWEEVLTNLAPLPVQDGKYVLYEGVPEMWTKYNFEHPALIGTYGMLPGDGVDVPTLASTLEQIGRVWNFGHVWGWDFPMLAMSAARLGKPDLAIDYLLHASPNFQFDERGLATGGPFPYFPSNGGLLYAVAMMAAGWDGADSNTSAPGFPPSWNVRHENLAVAP
jgi:hypothetical protein